MRDVFLEKIKDIQQSDSSFLRNISPPSFLVYENENGNIEKFKLVSEEHFCIRAVMDSFFVDDHDSHIPTIKEDDIELEVFAHSCSNWLNSHKIEEIAWLQGGPENLTERGIADLLGQSQKNDRFESVSYQSGYIGKYLSFLEDRTLKLYPLREGSKLRRVISKGFPIPYLSGLIDDPHQIDWEGVSQEAFTLYLCYFASPEEKKPLFLSYV